MKRILYLTFVLVFLLWVDTFAEQMLVDEQFQSFDENRWRVDKPTSFNVKDGILNIGRVHGLGTADVYSSPVARLSSFDYFRYSTFEAKIKFAAELSGVHTYYFGFFNRDNWGKTSCWVTSSGDNITLSCKAKDGKKVNVASKGGFEQDKWYVFKIIWSDRHVELFVDGQSIGSFDDPDLIPDSFMPAVCDIYASDGSHIGLQVDYIKVSGGEKITASRPPTEIVLPTNEELYPSLPMLSKLKPSISIIDDGKKALLENTHYSVTLALNKGVSVSEALNKYIGLDCLDDNGSKLFVIEANKTTVDSSDFVVTKSKIVSHWLSGKKILRLALSCDVPKIEADLDITIDDTPNIELRLDIKNGGYEKLVCHIAFPYVENINIGDLEDNYYFYPHQAGWCGNAPYDLREEYGLLCWTQVMATFNRDLGGGISTWVKDKTGGYKVMRLRKVEKENYKPITFNSVHMKINEPDYLPINLQPGIMMAIARNEKEILPGQSASLPNAVIAVHPGDWRYPLFEYKKWAHTWYRHVGMPEWVKKNFHVVYIHDRLGNEGFEKGFYSKDKNQYIMSDSIEEGREDQHLEIAQWWQYKEDPNVPWGGLDKCMMGDYDYVDYRGGQEGFANEIKKSQQKGTRISIYMEVTQCWKGTRIGQENAKEWGRMDSPGQYNRDYCVKPDDGYIVCPYVDGWQDYVTERFAQIMKETGADGYRLDRGALMYPCFNADHEHYDGTAESAVPAKKWRDFLNKARKSIQKDNPEAALFTEHAASDYLTQFHHGSTSQQFEWRYHEYEDKKVFNTYDLMFFRYLFPQYKLYNWGQTFEDGSRTAFFNSNAFERSDLEPGQVWYYSKVAKLLTESADVFATLNPVPLMRTRVDYLYANKFPLKEKIIYTMYNKNDTAVEGELIEIEHMKNSHYVDLFNDREVSAEIKADKAILSFELPSMEVVAVAQFPKILAIEKTSDKLIIKLNKRLRYPEITVLFDEDKGKGKTLIIKRKSAIFDLEEGYKGKKVIIKLFNNDYLQDEIAINL